MLRRWSRGRRDLLSEVYCGGWGLSSDVGTLFDTPSSCMSRKRWGVGAGVRSTQICVRPLRNASETPALCPGDQLCGRQATRLPRHGRWPRSPVGTPLLVTAFLAYTFGLRHAVNAERTGLTRRRYPRALDE